MFSFKSNTNTASFDFLKSSEGIKIKHWAKIG